eukprot:scaffold11046_cov183-Amphora_coffeaeformis.AAC.22
MSGFWFVHSRSTHNTMRSFVAFPLTVLSCHGLHMISTQDRRSFVQQAAAWTVAAGSSAGVWWTPVPAEAAPALTPPLTERLNTQMLKQPPSMTAAGELGSPGIDNTYFPEFMAGTWQVTQTLVDATTPLGLVYVGGPNGSQSIAEKTMAETRSRLNQPVNLQLRFVKTKWGVAEDRVFNNAQRLNAFAGRKVVATVDYADVGASNRAAILKNGGTAEDPLSTILVRYKGPAAQKVFVTSHATTSSEENQKWFVSEGQRSIFALTNENTAPPIFTDTEILYQLESEAPDRVKARLRLAGYLNAQSDKLYFDARNRAVSILDSTLDMERISST